MSDTSATFSQRYRYKTIEILGQGSDDKMTPERWARVRAVVERAMALPPPDRIEFLHSGAADADLVEEAEQLVSFDTQASAIFPTIRKP